ncbi:MAG: metallophosphoesterase [Desulfarculaceae bacterium]|nr:metallophosphoesterase [Desulfarculaceae bacterium]
MTVIAHISDLHFGSLQPGAPQALLQCLGELEPSLVIVSGDLTQRACPGQFLGVRRFLDKLRWPRLVLPGNHDMPLHRPVLRVSDPLRDFHRYVTPKDSPYLLNGGLAVLCLDTTNPWRWKGGGAPRQKLERLERRLSQLPAGATRLLVTHHPAFAQEGERQQAWQARVAEVARRFEVRLALSGHFHHTVIRPWDQQRLLVVEAGTATSNRLRGEPNAFNVLTLGVDRVNVAAYHLSQGVFAPALGRSFTWDDGAWLEQGPLPVAG